MKIATIYMAHQIVINQHGLLLLIFLLAEISDESKPTVLSSTMVLNKILVSIICFYSDPDLWYRIIDSIIGTSVELSQRCSIFFLQLSKKAFPELNI